MAALARNVARDLQTAALPELTDVANELGMTAFIAVSDGQGSAVTLVSVEPRHAVRASRPASGQQPLDRHRGAPDEPSADSWTASPGDFRMRPATMR